MADHFHSIINMMIISSKTNKHINKKQQKRKKKNSLRKYLRAKSCRLLSSKTFIVDHWQGPETPLVSFARDSCAFISNFEQVSLF